MLNNTDVTELEHWSAASNFCCGETEPRKSYTPPTLLSGAVWLNPSVKVPDCKGPGRGHEARAPFPAPSLIPSHLDPLQSETAPQGAGPGVLGSSARPSVWVLRFWAQSFEGDPGGADLLNLQEQSSVFAGLGARPVWTAQVIGKQAV